MQKILKNEEQLLSLDDLRRHVIPPGPSGSPVSRATLWRWHTRGLHGVQLEVVQAGRRVYSSVAALHRFWSACAQAQRAARASDAQHVETATDADLQAAGLL